MSAHFGALFFHAERGDLGGAGFDPRDAVQRRIAAPAQDARRRAG
jgi:hypothetical protein